MPTLVPDVLTEQVVYSLTVQDSARAAARLMIEHDVSAVIVLDGAGTLSGIVTEHDLARRIVGKARDADQTPIAEIMTPAPVVAAPDMPVLEALELMRRGRFRHLPVVAEGTVIGVVAIRDLRHASGDMRRSRLPSNPVLRLLHRLLGAR